MTTVDSGALYNKVLTAYDQDGSVSQRALYRAVAKELMIDPRHYVQPVSGKPCNLFHRKVRWAQQSLKQKGLITQKARGYWSLTCSGKKQLHTIKTGRSVLAMSTRLGLMICADSHDFLDRDIIQDDIHLVLTSPPYLLRQSRDYGGPEDEYAWVDFITKALESILPRLVDGASIMLNVGQDSFIPNLPARHQHIERLSLALSDRLDLYLIDRMVWESNKITAPTQYVSRTTPLLSNGYEFVLWFSNNPLKLRSDNMRVRQPLGESYTTFINKGGIQKESVSGDGAYRKRQGDYQSANLQNGKVAKNAFYIANKCRFNELCNAFAKAHHLPLHGAKMPYRLAEFLIAFASKPGDLVLDFFSGTGVVGQAAHCLERRYILLENVREYIMQSFIRFTSVTDDVYINPEFKL